MEKVTEIMCYYNEEKYLQTAIQSILDQSYKNIELILINDGSTDRSEEIARKFGDARIVRVSNQENHGLAWCRNQGLELATGDYVGFFDADDIADRFKVEKQVRFLDEHKEILIVSGSYDYIDKQGNRTGRKAELSAFEDLDIRAKMLFENVIAGPCALFRRKIIDQYGVWFAPEMRTSQDYHFWLNCLQFGKVYNMNEVLFHYRTNHNSQSIQIRKKDEKRYDEILLEIYEYAWKTRGFRLDQADITFIFTFLYRKKRLWKLKDLLHALRLYRKVRIQAGELHLPESDRILANYRNALKRCFFCTKAFMAVKRRS